MCSKKEIDDNLLEDVVGGVDNFFVKLNRNEKYEVKYDDNWVKMVREVAKKFDSQSIHFCVVGSCPGCGKMVGIAGDVCEDCRKKAKCLK